MRPTDQPTTSSRYQVSPRTLCFVFHGDEVLLLHGAPDKPIWPGQYNGVGGHVRPDEDVRSAALREIHEETGLTVRDLLLRGIVHIPAPLESRGVLLFVFTAIAPDKTVRPSQEGKPEWIAIDKVYRLDLVEDLPILLPRILSTGQDVSPFFALYKYDDDRQLIVTFQTDRLD